MEEKRVTPPPYQPLSGVYSLNEDPQIGSIYYFEDLESLRTRKNPITLKNNSYVFSNHPIGFYHINAKQEWEQLPLTTRQSHDIKKLIKSLPENAPTVRRKKLGEGCDFYILKEPQPNLTEYIRDIDGKNRYAYCLVGSDLFFVDLAKMRRTPVVTIKNITAFKKRLGMPEKSDLTGNQNFDVGITSKELVKSEIDYIELHKKNTIQLLPLNDILDEKWLSKFVSLVGQLTPIPGQYNCYEATINIEPYPPNSGDPLEPLFNDNTVLMIEKIKGSLQGTVYNKNWRQYKIENIKKQTIRDPGWLATQFTTLLGHFLGGQIPHGPQMAAMAHKARKEMYHGTVIAPRTKQVYPLQKRIGRKFLFEQTVEQNIGEKIALGSIPYNYAKVWIVSDVSPDEINNKEELSVTAGSSSFLCFTKEDADTLSKNIQDNYPSNRELLDVKPVIFDQELLSIKLMDFYWKIFDKFNEEFKEIINKQEQYKNDISAIKTGGLNQGVGPSKMYQAKLNTNIYPQFEQIEQLSRQITSIQEQLGKPDSINISKINKDMAALIEGLKNYVKEHPYKNMDNSIVHALLGEMMQLEHYFPELQKEADEEIALEKEVDGTIQREFFDKMKHYCNKESYIFVKNYYQKKVELLRIKYTGEDDYPSYLEKKYQLAEIISKVDMTKFYIKNLSKEDNKHGLSNDKEEKFDHIVETELKKIKLNKGEQKKSKTNRNHNSGSIEAQKEIKKTVAGIRSQEEGDKLDPGINLKT